MTIKPLVSVLTPIYNVERYLIECLESLKAQTLEDIEFICINDGSTDGSFALLTDCVQNDERFRIIDKPNSGYGKTMNLGLSLARGKYIGIVESDDYVDSTCFADLYEIARVNDCPDIVKANHYVFQEVQSPQDDTQEKLFVNYPPAACGRVLTPEDPEWEELVVSSPAIWAAVYRRDFLEHHQIRFNETPGASFQDMGFANNAWVAAERAYVADRAYLHYREFRKGSSSKLKDRVDAPFDEYAFTDEFMDRMGGVPKPIREMMAVNRLQAYWWNMRRIAPGDRGEFVEKARNELVELDLQNLWNPERMTPGEYKRLDKWINDPDSLLLDLRIQEIKQSHGKLAALPWRIVRKMRR